MASSLVHVDNRLDLRVNAINLEHGTPVEQLYN